MVALGQIIAMPAIALIIYAVLSLYHKMVYNSKNNVYRRLTPLWALILGILLAIVAYSLFPEIIPVTSLFTAAIMGGICGLSATGLNQLSQQLFDKKEEEEEKVVEPNKTTTTTTTTEETK